MKRVSKLDLHGVKHEDAKKSVILFIENHWGEDGENLEIITGHSNEMKQIVRDVLAEYKLECKEGSFDGRNMGMIRTEL
jgi:DNA-nicking Smr family endonuclease